MPNILRRRRAAGGGAPPPPPPPQSPALFFAFDESGTMARTGDLVDSITDKVGSVVATSSGGNRPSFFASDVANGGPPARTRFAVAGTPATPQFMSIPASVSIDRRNCSLFVISRTSIRPIVSSANQMSFLISSETTVRTGVYQWTNDELRVWNNSAAVTGSGVAVPHNTSVQWMTSGAADYQIGAGSAVFSSGTPLSATNQTTTGGRIGIWTGTSFPLTGDILGVLIYNRQLNTTERNEVLTWARTRYGAPSTTSATVVGFSGDSITEGISDANPQLVPHARDISYPTQIEQLSGGSFRYWNLGIGGQALQNNTAATQTSARLNAVPGSTRKVVFGLWGTNDVGGNRTGAQIRGDLDTWITNLRADISGVIIGHGTILERSGLSGAQATARADFNDYVMARGAYSGAGPNLDFRIDTAAISGLTNPADTTKFHTDGLHPIRAGYADLAAGIWNGGLSAQII
jgi:lysophospholipase L1-like esterase